MAGEPNTPHSLDFGCVINLALLYDSGRLLLSLLRIWLNDMWVVTVVKEANWRPLLEGHRLGESRIDQSPGYVGLHLEDSKTLVDGMRMQERGWAHVLQDVILE